MNQEDSQQDMTGAKTELPNESFSEGASELQDAEGGDEEGETRCICKELDPPEDSGLYIQCEQCGVWQHGYCVGIFDGEDDYLEKYWCEQCKPELHRLYTVDSSGTLRSVYQPIQEKRKHVRRNSRQRPNSNPSLSSQVEDPQYDSPNLSLRGTPEKNPTDDSKESRPRSSRPKRNLHKSSVNGNGELDRGSENMGTIVNSNSNENGKSDHSADGKLIPGTSSLLQDHPIDDEDEDDKKLQDRKRATFSAREEKHYQWMLEKAIRESRRTSQHGDNPEEVEDDKESAAGVNSVNEGGRQIREPTASKANQGGNDPWKHNGEAKSVSSTERAHLRSTPANYQEVTNSDSSATGSNGSNSASGPTTSTTNRTKDEPVLSRSGSMNSNSEDESKKPKKSKKGSNRRNRSSGNNSGAKAGGSPKGRLKLGVNKPMKPRLPSQRTSLNEMRRRVSAILEFISRTQWELSEDQSSRDDLIRFVENQQFIERVDSIFESHDHTLKLMDDLTRALLLWEKKYSNSPSLQE